MKINKIILLAIFSLMLIPLFGNPFYSTNTHDSEGETETEKRDVLPVSVPPSIFWIFVE